MKRLVLLIALCLCCLPATTAQTTEPGTSETLRHLLSLPAPTPRTAETAADADKHPKARSRQFYDTDNVPADDAPQDELLDYWGQ